MTNITIPKKPIENKDLVAVPRTTYGEFLAWQKTVKSARTFKPSSSEKKSLAQARKNFSRGKYVPLEKLEHELGVTHR